MRPAALAANWRPRNPLDFVRPRTVRIGVTGLARSGKTVLLSALAAELLAPGGRFVGRLAPAGAGALPRFDHGAHLAALAADPPRWPDRTNTVSLLAVDLQRGRRALRLELLDYPGEWLLDLPLLGLSFADWSEHALAGLERAPAEAGAPFLAFVAALPRGVGADEALAASGHRLYAATLRTLRDAHGRSLLQPGRFLMPPPGPVPPWMAFFPMRGGSPLAGLLRRRFEAYVAATRAELVSPLFGAVDRLVVLADLLGALHAGPVAFADMQSALRAASGALRWQSDWRAGIAALAALRLPPGRIRRVAFAASKADHVAERQRGNLAALMGGMVGLPRGATGGTGVAAFAIAAARCTEDVVWRLDNHPVSAVRGRRLGENRMTRSYPGEVPDRPPDTAFWAHPFLAPPLFEPARLVAGGCDGVPGLGLDALLDFLLEDLL